MSKRFEKWIGQHMLLVAALALLGSSVASHLNIPDVLATPEGLKDEVGKAQHLQDPAAVQPPATDAYSLTVLGVLSACGT